jgi:hypothetical protein
VKIYHFDLISPEPLPPKRGVNSVVKNVALSADLRSPLGVRGRINFSIFLKYQHFSSLIIMLFTLFSCTERIEIDPGTDFTRLVVDGSITTEKKTHTVLLTTTAGYFSNLPVPAVSGASVTISDGFVTYKLTEKSPGSYQTTAGISGIPGHLYTLKIKLTTPIGGYSEYSGTSQISPPVVLDSIRLKFNSTWSEKGIWEVKGFFLDHPGTDFYRFLMFKNGTVITDTLSDWYVTDDQFFDGKYLNGTTLAWLQQDKANETLKTGDTVTAEVDVIEKEFADFIRGARFNLSGSNPLFSGPAANVKGNINNGAIGFFSAYSVSRARITVPELH